MNDNNTASDSNSRDSDPFDDECDGTGRRSHRHAAHSGRKGGTAPSFPPPSTWLARYNDLLDRRPVRTKMVTAFCTSAVGAALGSYLSAGARPRRAGGRRGPGIDWTDVFAYAVQGGVVNAPLVHYWFEWLHAHGPASDTASVLVDQLVVQPPLLVLMYVVLDVLRANVRATLRQFREASVVSSSVTRALRVVPSSWRFWPVAVYLTFKYCKKKHYAVVLNLCSVAWTVFLARGAAAAGAE